MTDDISKLPKWAQDIIRTLSRERDTAINALNSYIDSDTVSEIYVDEYLSTGEQQGPTMKRHYIQGHTINFEHAEIELEVVIYQDDNIGLKWNAMGRGDVAFVPESYQSAKLIHKKNMR